MAKTSQRRRGGGAQGSAGQFTSALARADDAIGRVSTVQELLDAVCGVAAGSTGIAAAWIAELTPDTQEVRLHARAGVKRTDAGWLRSVLGAGTDARAVGLDSGRAAAFPLVVAGTRRATLVIRAEAANALDREALVQWGHLATAVALAWAALEPAADGEGGRPGPGEDGGRFQQAFAQTGVGSALLTLDGRILAANRALCTLLGRSAEELEGVDTQSLIHPDDRAGTSRRFLAATRGEGPVYDTFERRIVRDDGSVLILVVRGCLLWGPDGAPRDVLVQVEDVTARRQAEELAARRTAQQALIAELGRMALGERDLGALFHRAAVMVASGVGVEFSKVLELEPGGATCRLRAGVGWDAGLVGVARVGTERGSQAGYTLQSQSPVIVADLTTETRFEGPPLLTEHGVRAGMSVLINAGGRPFGVLGAHTRSPRVFTGDDIHFLDAVANILGAAVARRTVEQEMRRRALHDPLTGLPNEVLLLDRLQRALTRAARRRRTCAVLAVDLDRFKVVNESLGHPSGDALLALVAERLTRVARRGDTVARAGGDTFVLIHEEVGRAPAVLRIAERIHAALAAPFDAGGEEVFLTASIGAVLATSTRASAATVLRDAELATAQAKAGGGASTALFEPSMRGGAGDLIQMETALRHALERGELVVHYQPIIDLLAGGVAAAEALIRWRHPTRGLVAPSDFVPRAEETGLIIPIGYWVLQQACRDSVHWAAERGGAPLTVSVNVSVVQLRDPGFPAAVATTLAETGIPPSSVCLEITESGLMADVHSAISMLGELRALGVGLAVDDFGTGYSSLAYLKRLPITQLKVDRSFVSGLPSDADDSAIVGSIVGLARSLSLAVVAEGVETPEQLAEIRSLRCEFAQGYLISRPVDAAAFQAHWAPDGSWEG
ncbi:MAG TPA: EAL domain-containing protein [Candidatus Dormibacteraeota bacterium]|nr:EAL domain-containing protein [Candidatus Dormibacteraeota bacterium]